MGGEVQRDHQHVTCALVKLPSEQTGQRDRIPRQRSAPGNRKIQTTASTDRGSALPRVAKGSAQDIMTAEIVAPPPLPRLRVEALGLPTAKQERLTVGHVEYRDSQISNRGGQISLCQRAFG